MFDPKSDYALNKKDPEAIIHMDSTGILVKITPEDFPSVEDFQLWKAWSDENYHMTEKEGHVFYNHTTSFIDPPEQATTAQSAEEVLVNAQEERERQDLCYLLMAWMDRCLTPIQRRRLWLSCVEGLTVRQISQLEHTAHQNVSKSIRAAKKKLVKCLFDRVPKPGV